MKTFKEVLECFIFITLVFILLYLINSFVILKWAQYTQEQWYMIRFFWITISSFLSIVIVAK